MAENWTEIKIQVPAAQADLAGDIANMVVPYGIYICLLYTSPSPRDRG